MKVEVTVDTSRLDRKLADLPACLARAQKRALQAIGAYSLYHQFGTRKMPARPFFPIDKNGELLPAMRRKIVGKVKKALREELEKL